MTDHTQLREQLEELFDWIQDEHDCAYKRGGLRISDEYPGKCYHLEDIFDGIKSYANAQTKEVLERVMDRIEKEPVGKGEQAVWKDEGRREAYLIVNEELKRLEGENG